MKAPKTNVRDAYERARSLMNNLTFGSWERKERQIASAIVSCRKRGAQDSCFRLVVAPGSIIGKSQISELLFQLAMRDDGQLVRFMKTVDALDQKTSRSRVLLAYVLAGVFLLQKRLPYVRELKLVIQQYGGGRNVTPSERHIREILKQLKLPRNSSPGRPTKNRK